MLSFETLRTPRNDGDVLVEPAAGMLRSLAMDNRSHLATLPGTLLGVDWATLRRQTRAAMGIDESSLIVMTGHQPEFIHPGVWAKNVVACQLAKRLGGTAFNLVVDNDVPKSLALAVPVRENDHWEARYVPFAVRGAAQPYEFLASLDAAVIEQIRENLQRLMGAAYVDSLMPVFLDGLEAAQRVDFVQQVMAARQAVEELFGVEVRDVRVSAVWGGVMLADWILRAREFADAYNLALAAYRREEHVRHAERPIPDLHVEGRRVEVVAWAYSPREPRKRLFVERENTAIRLFAEGELIGTIGVSDLEDATGATDALAGACRKVIRPRAVSLTLWARLLACDLFIHGIGGAKYDRITDAIIQSYYGFEPPAMACVSATLHLPLPRHAVTMEDLTAARRRLRDVYYQPDRWAGNITAAAPLLRERQEAIRRSDALHRDDHRNHEARQQVFGRIRELNAAVLALRSATAAEARAALIRLEYLREQDRIAGSREYFFALFPRKKLERLCAALPSVDAL